MAILGIDYGKHKLGLALATGKLAEPYQVIRYEILAGTIAQIGEIVKRENIEKVIIGVSEGAMAEESREFGQALKNELKIPVEFVDETLTTFEAQQKSIESGIKRGRRRALEDAFSATLILQSFLDQ